MDLGLFLFVLGLGAGLWMAFDWITHDIGVAIRLRRERKAYRG